VISGRLANILEKRGLAEAEPANLRAELFGNGKDTITFRWAMQVRLQIGGRWDWFKVYVLDGMKLDLLVGDDVLRALHVTLDYGKRMARAGGQATYWMTRGQVVSLTAFLKDCYPDETRVDFLEKATVPATTNSQQ
jgi:hypothetical protein